MPSRYIRLPEPCVLKDPITREELRMGDGRPELWSTLTVLNKIMSNPKWAESYANMRAQDAIQEAFDHPEDGVVQLAEEDWLKLKEAIESPRTQINTNAGPQVFPGYGTHPSLNRQLLQFLAPIMDATTVHPKR